MFGWGKKKPKTVEVTLIELGKDEAFGVSQVPVDQLPDTFEINTTLHLGDVDWQVVEARPATKAEFRETGKVTVVLAKQEIFNIDPANVLFSLPTISNDMAIVEAVSSLDNVLVLHEDDWRQFEFLSAGLNELVQQEIQDILAIYHTQREESGFKQLHVRRRIAEPLPGVALQLESLAQAFQIEKRFSGVAFNNAAATIVNGFAWQTGSGWIFWGQTDTQGNLVVLCLLPPQDADAAIMANKIDDFVLANNLLLIDWISVRQYGKNEGSFSLYE
ncbi:TPA: hypothetical protein ACSTJ0_000216 [Serratia fonticola]|jgi:hypothetical protein|uniref:hypothetical protein n=1 Tax=Serratia fonticola TaxID=47917 RepID=UPI00217AB2A6|nr:hypothetical protein [Serratia fonticola]CAI1731845.1 Uncharacterised protein [Serratia fonticola]CAI1752213.1 Uncharacterised protein [Serratia fonticola]CAI2437387.1 Uncharacterised protein [Serratia fonticola]